METAEALKIAHKSGFDLIEIAPTATPPVCRIMEFGKFKYEREKGERERSKKQKTIELKMIRLGFTTGAHDLELRARQIRKFLSEGNKVRIEMRLRGREKAHGALALKKFNEFLEMIPPPDFHLDAPPKRFPQGIITTISKQ